MAYIAHVVTGAWFGEVGISMPVCVLFVSQLYAEDPDHEKPILIVPNRLSKSGERAHDRYLISAVSEIRTHNLLIDSPACYHRANTAFTVFTHRQYCECGFEM